MKSNNNLVQASNMKWERNLSLVLLAIILVGGGVGAYSFISSSPGLKPSTPAEILMAERWFRVLLTVLWIGFSVFAVLLVILLSSGIGITSNILGKRNPSLSKKHKLNSSHDSTTVDP